MTDNQIPQQDVQLHQSTLHTFKKIIDSFPEDKRKMFSDSFNAIEDPSYKAEVIHNVILDAHPELSQVKQVNQDMVQGASMAGPIGLGAGMMKGAIPQDIPSIVGKLTSTIAGGVPQNVTRHPVMSLMGGQPAAIMASAAGQQGTGQNFGGNPKTMSGQMSGDALAALAPALMMGGGKNLPEVRGAMVDSPETTIANNLDKKVTEVLNPSKTDMQIHIDRGDKVPAIEQAGKVITKSKNYGELRNNIDNSIKSAFSKREELLKANNQEIGTDYLKPLKDLIAERSVQGSQVTDADINTMKNVLKEEEQFLGVNKVPHTAVRPDGSLYVPKDPVENKIDVLSAQKRKEYLQDLTEKLLERTDDGSKRILEPARYQALDALRSGLKQSIEDKVPAVKPINATYDGLKEARWLASGQKALADKEIPKNILQKIAGFFDTNPAGVAIKVASRENRKLGKVTSDIEGLQAALKNVRKSK